MPVSPEPLLPAGVPQHIVSLMSVFTMPTQEPDLSLQESNTLTYIAGYILKKVQAKLSLCSDCDKRLTATQDETDNSNYDFLKEKNYVGAKVGLKVPSTILVDFVKEMETEYVKLIDGCIYKERVKGTLIASLLKLRGLREYPVRLVMFTMLLFNSW